MPCGCLKNKAKKTFVYVAEDQTETPYPTEIEAKAAKVRAGGAGAVEVRTSG